MSFLLPQMLAQLQATQPAVVPNTPTQQPVTVSGNKNYTERIQKIAGGLNHPLTTPWTIVVLDKDQWNTWAKQNPNASKTDGAFSLLGSGRTFISQDWLAKWPDERLRRNLAHELGHLKTNSNKELDANKWADEYLKSLSK